MAGDATFNVRVNGNGMELFASGRAVDTLHMSTRRTHTRASILGVIDADTASGEHSAQMGTELHNSRRKLDASHDAVR